MSEKLPPQRPEQEQTPNHEKERLADRIPAIISKYEKKLAEAASEVEADKYRKKIEDLKNTLDRNSESPDTILTTPGRTTYNLDPQIETTEHIEHTDTAEDYDDTAEKANLTPAERKYNLMQSDEAQAAFMEGGDEAYIKFIEEGFKAVDESYSQELVPISKELQTQYVAETDAYGNPVQHQLEWSRNGAPVSTELVPVPKSKELVPIEKSKELVPVNNFELPAEYAERIRAAANEYALATAKDRHSSFFVGRYSKDPQSAVGRLLHKIPGFGKIRGFAVDQMDKIGAGDNKNHTEKMDQVRQNYEMQIALAKEALEKMYANTDIDPTKMLLAKAQIDGMSDVILENLITEHRHNESSDTNWLTEWWVSQDNAKFGKLKKAGAIIGVGAAAGAVGTLAAPVFGALSLGAAAGGLSGVIVANSVGKSRANAKGYVTHDDGKFVRDTNGKKVKHEKTIAERQAEEDIQLKKATHDTYVEEVTAGERTDEFLTSWNTEDVEARTTSEVKRNRDRIKRAKALGGIAGGLTGLGISSLVRADFDSAPTDAPAPKSPDAPAAPAPAPEAPHLNGEQFVVERGSGYTKELMQFAQANGHNLSPSQSFQLHEYLMSKFGPDYINIQGTGGHDIYSQAGDVRLSSPGNAEWVKGVTAEAQKWMAGRGLW